MKNKKFDPKYIKDANERLWEILNDKKEFDDWTQISLSVQNAVQAAANIWGTSSDEQVHNMNRFIREVVLSELSNLLRFDITFVDKHVALKLSAVEQLHKHQYNNLIQMVKKLIEGNGGNIALQDCKSWINGSDSEGNDCQCEVLITSLSIGENDAIVITYMQDDVEYVDIIDLFSYDELYDILCNACRALKLL